MIQLPDCIFWIYDYAKDRLQKMKQPNNKSRTSTVQFLASSIEAKGVDNFLKRSKEKSYLFSPEEIDSLKKIIVEWSKRKEEKLQNPKILEYQLSE